MAISFYNERGEFTAVLTGDTPVLELTKELSTSLWIDGKWFGKPFYALNGVAVPRPENPASLSGFTLTSVPVPAKVHINQDVYETNESTVELSFGQPGTYKVKVESWPYLDKEFSVENPA